MFEVPSTDTHQGSQAEGGGESILFNENLMLAGIYLPSSPQKASP